MARPLRIEFTGALYHVISRGIEKKAIFKDNRDRAKFFVLLEECSELLQAQGDKVSMAIGEVQTSRLAKFGNISSNVKT